FHRGLLRTKLLERGLYPELIDALLGHANAGELPFGQLSTFDFGAYRRSITRSLDALHRELGLRPLRSRLVHQYDEGHQPWHRPIFQRRPRRSGRVSSRSTRPSAGSWENCAPTLQNWATRTHWC